MPTNEWNAGLYDERHAFVFEYGKSLLSLLNAQPGESILDLGCGTGHLTSAIAEMGAHVVGMDSAPSMIEKARQSYPGIEFYVMDARNFSFPQPFDAIFSNAALHWIPEAGSVVRSMAAALKPGGRLVAEMGGRGNVAHIINSVQYSLREVAGIHVESGWYFPSLGQYTSLLEQHGLMVSSATLFDRPTKLEGGEDGLHTWITMFCGQMLQGISSEMMQQVIRRAEEQARGALFRDGDWFADYVRLRIVACKEVDGSI